MNELKLSDEQWLVLDLLLRAKERGISRLTKEELLSSSKLPQAVAIRLVWAALTMPANLIVWHGNEFSITDSGLSAFKLRFGQKIKPTEIADAVICLPGPDHYRN